MQVLREGFDLLMKWMAKPHLGLDLFGLTVYNVKKELMSIRPFEATAENVMEETIDVAKVIKEAPANLVPDEQ